MVKMSKLLNVFMGSRSHFMQGCRTETFQKISFCKRWQRAIKRGTARDKSEKCSIQNECRAGIRCMIKYLKMVVPRNNIFCINGFFTSILICK